MSCTKLGLMLGSGSLWNAAGVLEQRAEFYLNLVQICPTTPHHLLVRQFELLDAPLSDFNNFIALKHPISLAQIQSTR